MHSLTRLLFSTNIINKNTAGNCSKLFNTYSSPKDGLFANTLMTKCGDR